MRPFMRPWRVALGWFLIGLVLAGLAFAVWDHPDETVGGIAQALGAEPGGVAWTVAWPALLAAAACLCVAVVLAVRLGMLTEYLLRPNLLDCAAEDLNSTQPWARRLALQALADFVGHPFGLVLCWPRQRHSPEQFEALVLLYRDWLRLAREEEPPFSRPPLDPTAFRRGQAPEAKSLGERIDEALDHLADTIRDTLMDWRVPGRPARAAPEPWNVVRPEQLEEAMRGPVCEALLAVAETINESGDAPSLVDCKEQLQPLFDDLLHVALARAERLRVNAALADLPPAERDGWVGHLRRMRAGEGQAEEL
jgi:hypothetical protein